MLAESLQTASEPGTERTVLARSKLNGNKKGLPPRLHRRVQQGKRWFRQPAIMAQTQPISLARLSRNNDKEPSVEVITEHTVSAKVGQRCKPT